MEQRRGTLADVEVHAEMEDRAVLNSRGGVRATNAKPLGIDGLQEDHVARL